MAFVLIQHLEPTHDSALAAILSKATAMPVVEAGEAMRVEPNCVYVIPPNKRMTLGHGVLKLTPGSEARLRHPIDDFLTALAEQQGPASIGVLLSGTGSDGTRGLKAIKAAGGVTFAQNPKSAAWPSMPMSAITAGAVDFVMTVKRIAAELARIGSHPYMAHPPGEPLAGDDIEIIHGAPRSATGIDFRLYKQPTFVRRVARRVALLKMASLQEYAQTLEKDREEARALADDIFIHVTSFFRNPDCFEVLRKRIIAKWHKRKPAMETLRIWVPGCSTGEEVYSLAMLVLEEFGEQAQRMKIQFFGTDIQERPTAHARVGFYSESAVAGVSAARLKRFFVKVDKGYQIQPFVRELCVFARHDLARDPPFSHLDLISCRNVLIYLGPVLQKRVLGTFQYALQPGASLFLGDAEAIGGFSDIFVAEYREQRIFACQPASANSREVSSIFSPSAALPAGPGPLPLTPPEATAFVDLRKEVESVLLESYTPPALIVDANLNIVYFHGDTSPFLSLGTGVPSFHVLKMVHPALVVDLRTAIAAVRQSSRLAYREGLAFTWKGQPASVRLEVRPLVKKGSAKNHHLLIVFQNLLREAPMAAPSGSKGEVAERALASGRGQMQLVISERESAQEQMKVESEEILSSNEELETAKEELQSTNEELITLNEELQHRNADLGVLSTDLNSLLVNLDIPVLVLDGDLRVRRFTPAAGQLLNLIPGDIGRPFSNIACTLEGADWNALLRDMAIKGLASECEVKDRNGHQYSLRIRPHKPTGVEVSGAVVFLIDVDAVHRLEAARVEQQRTESILNSMAAHVAMIGPDGNIVAINEAWRQFAKQNGDPLLLAIGPGANYLEACERAVAGGDAEAIVALAGIRDVLSNQREHYQLEYPCGPSGAPRWFLLNVTPLKSGMGGAVIAHFDVTATKLAEISAVANEARIRALLESYPQSVIALEADGAITFVNGNCERLFGYNRRELVGSSISHLIPGLLRECQMIGVEPGVGHGIQLELEARRKDGSIFPVEVGLGAMESSTGSIAVAFISDITQRRQMESAAKTHASEVRALAANLLVAQEEERERVSRELHDDICQQLASLSFDIARLASKPVSLEHAQNRLKELQVRAVKAVEGTRHLAHGLHPLVLDDQGLVASLRDLCQNLAKAVPGLEVEFKADAMEGQLPREIASCFFRIAEASLHNIAQHSGASQAAVALGLAEGVVSLQISDDGSGFDPAVVKGRGGLGLIGMEERARLVNGKLTIESQLGHGTRTYLEIAHK